MRVDRDIVRGVVSSSVVAAMVVLAGCKRQPPPPAVRSAGTTVIPGTFAWDAESNAIAADATADFRWEQVSPTERYLVPINGTEAALVKHRGYDEVDGVFLSRWHMPEEKISASGEGRELTAGAVVAFRTGQGTLGKLRVVRFRSLHDLAFPGADALGQEWRSAAADRPDIERYHLEIGWTLYEPGQP